MIYNLFGVTATSVAPFFIVCAYRALRIIAQNQNKRTLRRFYKHLRVGIPSPPLKASQTRFKAI